jgi:sorbitol/mannitol transport system substrate-binding protein
VPEYKEAGGEFAELTKQIMSEVNPEMPGVKPQPWIGIQYVSIPEFQDVGNQVSQEIVDAIAGRQTVDQALEAGQRIAQRAGDLQKEEG